MSGSVASVLARVDAALDALAALDVGAADAAEVMRCRNRMEAIAARCARKVDREPVDHVSTATWLAARCRLSKQRARAMVANGRALADMPEVAAAFDAGAVSEDHVAVLRRAQRLAPGAFAKAEAELVDEARTLRFDVFARRVRYFEQLAEPDLVEARAQEAFERRAAFCSATFEDTRRVDATLDPVGGAIFQRELDRIERQLFEADWAEARARLGDDATADQLARTAPQRRADAMVQLAIRSAAMPADAKQARVLLSVLVGYETMVGRICELADGTVVTPGQVLPWLDRAEVERAVFGPDGRVIDLGRRARLFTGGARRAVELSDLECTHDGCDVRFERCDVDHAVPWATGGATDRANGRLRCPLHNPGRRKRRPLPAG